MVNKIIFFSVCTFSSVMVSMDKPLPAQQLQQSVHTRLTACELGLEKCAQDAKFANGEMHGRLDTLAKKNDAELKKLQALIAQKTLEAQNETAAINGRLDLLEAGAKDMRARIGTVEDAVAQEAQARQIEDEKLRKDLQAEMRNRVNDQRALSGRIEQATARIYDTQIVGGCTLGALFIVGGVALSVSYANLSERSEALESRMKGLENKKR